MGRDSVPPHSTSPNQQFQSTRPHGARHAGRKPRIAKNGFNPRARMGRDSSLPPGLYRHGRFQSTRPHGARRSLLTRSMPTRSVSIHAPAWGATGGFIVILHDGCVSIHAPAWGATVFTSGAAVGAASFNPRARMGRDRVISAYLMMRSAFQSTRPHGARPRAPWRIKCVDVFQSTRPHGARPGALCIVVSSMVFQSTRPHGARPRLSVTCSIPRSVSIHAPAWGATTSFIMFFILYLVSIHAPAWGATVEVHLPAHVFKVSIHAPAWGATAHLVAHLLQRMFQSTRPHGARLVDTCPDKSGRAFQSTRPHGARRNPNNHEVLHGSVSIHAPAWGATLTTTSVRHTSVGFNPRARMGRDRAVCLCCSLISSFQSTRPHGARRWLGLGRRLRRRFNPRARMGRDLVVDHFELVREVSIHAPAWGATRL